MDTVTDILSDIFVAKKNIRFSGSDTIHNYNQQSRIYKNPMIDKKELFPINETLENVETTNDKNVIVKTIETIPMNGTIIVVENDRPIQLLEFILSKIKYKHFGGKLYVFTDNKEKYQKHLLKNPHSKYNDYIFVDYKQLMDRSISDKNGIIVYDFLVFDMCVIQKVKESFRKTIIMQCSNTLCNISCRDPNTYVVFNHTSISTSLNKIQKIYNTKNTIEDNIILI